MDALWGYMAVAFSLVSADVGGWCVVSVALTGAHRTAAFPWQCAVFLVFLFSAAFCASRGARQLVHAWLATGSPGLTTAAGIAALIGDAEPGDVIAGARKRLRGIPANVLTPAIFDRASSDGNRWYKEHAIPVDLNEVDAFVSHSYVHCQFCQPRAPALLGVQCAAHLSRPSCQPRALFRLLCMHILSPAFGQVARQSLAQVASLAGVV